MVVPEKRLTFLKFKFLISVSFIFLFSFFYWIELWNYLDTSSRSSQNLEMKKNYLTATFLTKKSRTSLFLPSLDTNLLVFFSKFILTTKSKQLWHIDLRKSKYHSLSTMCLELGCILFIKIVLSLAPNEITFVSLRIFFFIQLA